MFTLDKSKSMYINFWDHDNDVNSPDITRWNSLHNVVSSVAPQLEADSELGANLFPAEAALDQYNFLACQTDGSPEVGLALNNAQNIIDNIPAALDTDQYGATPMRYGLEAAYTELLGGNPDAARSVILITDGAANCAPGDNTPVVLMESYDDGLPAVVADAYNNWGIETYVVGIDIADADSGNDIDGQPDNINPTTKLTELAVSGGTNTFYNAADEQDLIDALVEITENVVSCIVPLDPPPFFPDFTKVFIGGVEIPKTDDCANDPGGWMYTDGNFTAIELCPDACDLLADAGSADIEYHCTPG
jgi:hypothetical protein